MPELVGQITHVEPAPPGLLWAAVVLPLAIALALALFGDRLRASALRLAVASAASVVAAVVGATIALFGVSVPSAGPGAPPAPVAIHALAYPLLRVGSLDVPLALSLDRMGAVLALVVAVAGGAALVAGALALRAAPSLPRFTTGVSAALGGLLLVVLADNAVLLCAGWVLTALAGGLLATLARGGYEEVRDALRAMVIGRAGELALALGTALLFWGLGGQWYADGRFTADYRPRFIAVETIEGSASSPIAIPGAGISADLLSGQGRLSMTTHPGARVFLGITSEDQLGPEPTPFGVAPFFEQPLPAGLHKIAILPGRAATVGGDGNEAALIDVVEVRASGAHAIAPLGPSVTFREIEDQLRLKDAEGNAPLWGGLRGKRVWTMGEGGLRVTTAVALLFAIAAMTRAGQLPFGRALWGARRAPLPVLSVLLGLIAVIPVATLLARFHYLFGAGDAGSVLLGTVGAATAIVAALEAVRASERRELLSSFVVSQMGLVLIAVAAGALGAAVGLAAHVGLAVVAVVASEIARAPKLQATALLWAGAVVPLGGFWARHDALRRALAFDGAGFLSLVWLAAGLTTAGLVAFAVTRQAMLLMAPPAKAKKKAKPPSVLAGRVALAVVALAVAGSTAACIPGFALGDAGMMFDAWLRRPLVDAPPGGTWLAALSLAAVLAGASAARRGGADAKGAREVLPSSVASALAALDRFGDRVESAVMVLRRVTREIQEGIVDVLPGLLATAGTLGVARVRRLQPARAWVAVVVVVVAAAAMLSSAWWSVS